MSCVQHVFMSCVQHAFLYATCIYVCRMHLCVDHAFQGNDCFRSECQGARVYCCARCCSILLRQSLTAYTRLILACSSMLHAVTPQLQHTATHCNTLQHTATHCNTLHHTAPHCNTQHNIATHVNTLQLFNTLQHTATHCSTLQHTAAHCSTLQHTAAHCSTLQHPTACFVSN